jgi:hypothetical protein
VPFNVVEIKRSRRQIEEPSSLTRAQSEKRLEANDQSITRSCQNPERRRKAGFA